MGARRAVINGSPAHNHIFHEPRWAPESHEAQVDAPIFTRLTNRFPKKVENLEAAVALHYMHYNFCRIHQSLPVTPAMESGVSEHILSLDEIINLL